MKRREPPAASGYLFNGRTYPTEAEYLAARKKWQDRRQHLLAVVSDEDGRDA